MARTTIQTRPRASDVPSLLVGFALGGLLDSIVLHQLLRWHHLVSDKESPASLSGLEANTVADGVFNAAMWLLAALGVYLLSRSRVSPTPRALAAWALVGWGVFNVTDQLVFHLALELHHIRPGPNYQLYDWGFFALGLLLVLAGLALSRAATRR